MSDLSFKAKTSKFPVKNINDPASIKSTAPQFTSLLNCIAINGTSKKSPVAKATPGIELKNLSVFMMSFELLRKGI
jgi:hypothetical protein